MNYEEYADRMTAQKRKPVEREHYEDIVEVAYMALGEVDKDEFCGLSDKTIGAVRRLADRVETAEKREHAADEGCTAAQAALLIQQKRAEAAEQKVAELTDALRARNELLEALVAGMKPADIVQTLLAR